MIFSECCISYGQKTETKIPVDYTATRIRQYFTKGCCFENMGNDKFQEVMNKLNHRPRKTLNYKKHQAVLFCRNLARLSMIT